MERSALIGIWMGDTQAWLDCSGRPSSQASGTSCQGPAREGMGH